jgi:hypothetical protein
VFVDVLVLCAAAGLTSLGTIAIDGTKVGANASMAANRNAEAIRAEVAAILADAAGADADEDDRHGPARGDELSPELANPISRLARLQAALERLEAVEAQADAEELARAEAEVEAKVASARADSELRARNDEIIEGHRIVGRNPRAPEATLAFGVGDDVVTMTRAELMATRACQAAAAGARLSGAKPKDPASALVRARADLEATLVRLEAKAAEREARVAAAAAAGRALRGPEPKGFETAVADWCGHDDELPASLNRALGALHQARALASAHRDGGSDDNRRVNLTDPDSRIVKTPTGFIQGYNAQAAINDNQIVIAATVTQDGTDHHQLVPMMAAVAANATAAGIDAEVGMVLADAGYWSAANAVVPGPPRLIATKKSWRQRRAARELGQTSGPPPQGASPLEAMEHTLRTPEGAAAYARRSVIIEPVFGDTKHNRGFRRFMRRGLDAVQSEWSLIATTHNVLKLFRQQAVSQMAVRPLA